MNADPNVTKMSKDTKRNIYATVYLVSVTGYVRLGWGKLGRLGSVVFS